MAIKITLILITHQYNTKTTTSFSRFPPLLTAKVSHSCWNYSSEKHTFTLKPPSIPVNDQLVPNSSRPGQAISLNNGNHIRVPSPSILKSKLSRTVTRTQSSCGWIIFYRFHSIHSAVTPPLPPSEICKDNDRQCKCIIWPYYSPKTNKYRMNRCQSGRYQAKTWYCMEDSPRVLKSNTKSHV